MSSALKNALARARAMLAAGALAASAASLILSAGPAADAATPSCGGGCIDVFSHDFGTFARPGFVVDDFKQGQAAGQPVILFRTSNQDPAEDFTVSAQGTVADFYAAGLVSSAVALNYGCTTPAFPDCSGKHDYEAFEAEYAPYGADTGLCTGVARTAFSGEKVTLQPCGTSSRTLWIVDFGGSPATISQPLINGSDTNFSRPFVLTYPFGAYPTDSPRPALEVSNLTGSSSGNVNDTQLWAFVFGQLF